MVAASLPPGMVIQIPSVNDGLVNLTSGMGTSRDKASQATYTKATFDSEKVLNAYANSSFVQRAVDMPSEDAVRQWRDWQADSTDITFIEAEEKRLNLKMKVLEALRLSRLVGGAAILIGNGDKDPREPIDWENMEMGGIKYLTVLSRDDITAGLVEDDVMSEGYGKPKYWYFTTSTGGMQQVHPSRLAFFYGVPPLITTSRNNNDGWGYSDIAGKLDRIIAVEELASNISSLVYEAKIDVFKIPKLMKNLSERGVKYEQEVLSRLSLASLGKSNTGSLLMDGDEEYEQKSFTFGGLHEIMDRMMQLASGATGIPVTLFFGISPGGLNATGDADIRNYYDRVSVYQETRMTPGMRVLDECLIRSAIGERPNDLHYEWASLWQTSDEEKVENGKTLAETFKILAEMGTYELEVIGMALANALTENGSAPGLEELLAEFGEEGVEGE